MPDRRKVLAGVGLGIALPMAGRATDAEAPLPGEAVVSRMLAMIADLPTIARSRYEASPAIAAIVRSGGRVIRAIPAGHYLATNDPLRLYARVPVASAGGSFEIALVGSFAGASVGQLVLLEVRESPIDPFASVATASQGDKLLLQMDWQAEYDRLASGAGGILALPPGRLSLNLVLHSRRVHIVGSGRGATILQPANPALPVLRAEYREGSWGYVTIANLDLDGAGSGIAGFVAGADRYVPDDEFAGRTRFENVGIAGFRNAIVRTVGQIGMILDSCVFGMADTHLLSRGSAGQSGEPMHAGILIARDCHFQDARVCVARFESGVIGTGGVLFDNCIMERNPGIVFDIAGFANADMTTDFVIRDCWNEMNGNASGQGQAKIPYAAIRDAGMVRFEGTPIGPLSIRNSAVETYACPLDAMTWLETDNDSTLRHHEARGFGSMVPLGLAVSVAAAWQSDPPGRALTFELPSRDYSIHPKGGLLLAASTAERPERWLGSHTVESSFPDTTHAGLRAVQKLSLPAGARVFPTPVAVPSDTWLVWAMTCRHVEGGVPQVQVTGDRGISFGRPMNSKVWQTLGGMAKVAPSTRETSIWFIQGSDPGSIEYAGYCLACFESRQDAIAFLNAGLPYPRSS